MATEITAKTGPRRQSGKMTIFEALFTIKEFYKGSAKMEKNNCCLLPYHHRTFDAATAIWCTTLSCIYSARSRISEKPMQKIKKIHAQPQQRGTLTQGFPRRSANCVAKRNRTSRSRIRNCSSSPTGSQRHSGKMTILKRFLSLIRI